MPGPVKKAAEFEAQMSTVKAISNASAGDMKRLSEEAKHMGATTQFTAVEAGKPLNIWLWRAGRPTKCWAACPAL